jgi:DNA gyrase subunit B
MHKTEKRSALEVVLTVLHAGGKFDQNSYKVSGGLHGVGVSCVNALSEWLEVEVRRDGVYPPHALRARQDAVTQVEKIGKTKGTGTKVTFFPDASIFTIEFNWDTLVQPAARAGLPEQGLEIKLRQEEPAREELYFYKGGISEFIAHLNRNKQAAAPQGDRAGGREGPRGGGDRAAVCGHLHDTIFSYVNNINTVEGGTHLSGFRTALTRTVNQYGKANKLIKDDAESMSGDDIREGLTAVVSVKVPDPQFEGQTKTKLGNGEVEGIVASIVNEQLASFFEENPPSRARSWRRGAGRAGPRGGPQGARPDPAQGRAGGQRAAGQAGRLFGARPREVRAVHRGGRLGRRLGQAGPRPAQPGHPAPARQDPERGEGARRQDAGQREIQT